MADLLQIVEFPYEGSRPRTVLDLSDLVGFAYQQGSIKITPGARRRTFATSDRRYGGSGQVDESTDNASFGWTAHVRGVTADQLAANVELLLATIDAHSGPDRRLMWRAAGGQARPTYMRLQGTGDWTPAYDSLKAQGGRAIDVDLSLPVHPLAELDGCDIVDLIDQDTIALGDWRQDTGQPMIVDADLGRFDAPVNGLHALTHVGRGWTFTQWDTFGAFAWRAIDGTTRAHVYCKVVDEVNRLGAFVDGTTLKIAKVDAGALVVLASTACVLDPGSLVWVRCKVLDGIVLASASNTDPERADSLPWVGATAGRLAQVSFPLSAPDTAKYALARGRAGVGVEGLAATSTPSVCGMRAYPFSRVSDSSSRALAFPDEIPGTAPARADVTVIVPGAGGGGRLPTFGLVALYPRPVVNLIRVGDFITGGDTAGEWTAAATTFLHAAGAIASYSSADGPVPGGGFLRFTTPGAVPNEGVSARVEHPFVGATRYAIRVWLRAAAGAPTVETLFGQDVAGVAHASSGPVVLSTDQWTPVDVEYVNQNPTDVALLTLRTPATAAVNVKVGGVVVGEGRSADLDAMSRRQRAGFGGRSLGRTPAAATIVPPLGWARTAAPGFGSFLAPLVDTAPSAATAYRAEWQVDATALEPDDMSEQATVEVWVRWLLDPLLVAPRAILWVEPEVGSVALGVAGRRQYASLGATGRPLDSQPLGGAQRALWKPHGTVTLPVGGEGRHRLILTAQLGAGTAGGLFGLADLLLVPAARRQATPTGVPGDASYPRLGNRIPFAKRILSDGSGRLRLEHVPEGFDTGLGGPPLQPPAGDRPTLLVVANPNVPDDPTPAATSDLDNACDVRLSIVPRARLLRGA